MYTSYLIASFATGKNVGSDQRPRPTLGKVLTMAIKNAVTKLASCRHLGGEAFRANEPHEFRGSECISVRLSCQRSVSQLNV